MHRDPRNWETVRARHGGFAGKREGPAARRGLVFCGLVVLSGCSGRDQRARRPGAGAGCTGEQVDAGGALGEIARGITRGCRDDHESCSSDSPDVAVGWTAPYSGCFVFDTVGSSFDTVLTVLDADGNSLECNDDGPEGTLSRVSTCVDGGTRLTLVVDGWYDAGAYVLNAEGDGDSGGTTTSGYGPEVGQYVAGSLTGSELDFALEGYAVAPCDACSFSLQFYPEGWGELVLDFTPFSLPHHYVYANGEYVGIGPVSTSGAYWSNYYWYRSWYGSPWSGEVSW